MMGKLSFSVLVLVCLMFGSLTVCAQKSGNYDQPIKISVDNVENPGEREDGTDFSPLTEAFYPIGFSKSGKFAYYVEPADEA